MKIRHFIVFFILSWIMQDKSSLAQTPIPITGNVIIQSENSVFIDRTSPTIDPFSFNVLNSNNSGDWLATACSSSNSNVNYAASNAYGADLWTSGDGGNSWPTGSNNGLGGGNSGDPSVCIDLRDYSYIAYLDNNTDVVVASSNNSWNGTNVTNVGDQDKEDLWVDNKKHTSAGITNTNQGNLYIAWMDANGHNQFSYSYDQNTTWPVTEDLTSGSDFSGVNQNQGVNIKTGPNGEVYVCWITYPCDPSLVTCQENHIAFAYSTDGGISFPNTQISANIQTIQGLTNRTFKGTETMETTSFPVMAVNQQNGDIYIVWGDNNNNNGFRVFMITSSDNGASWNRVSVGNGNYSDQWQPWIACDDASGIISVIYYATFQGAPNDVYPYVSYSYDEGATWTDAPLSSSPWNGKYIGGIYRAANGMGYAGDYLGLDVFAGLCEPVWSDNVSGSNTVGQCTGPGNMLAYSEPMKILCNPDPWSFCSTNPYLVSDYAFYQSQQSITTPSCQSFTIQPSGYVTMQAGTTIELAPGFSTNFGGLGGYFHASIGTPCSSPPHSPIRGNSSGNNSNGGNNTNTTAQVPNDSNAQNDAKLTLMPNPTRGIFSLQITQESFGTDSVINSSTYIYVYNVFGQIVYQTVQNQNALIRINLSEVPPGIYLVKEETNNRVYYKKLVKE